MVVKYDISTTIHRCQTRKVLIQGHLYNYIIYIVYRQIGKTTNKFSKN